MVELYIGKDLFNIAGDNPFDMLRAFTQTLGPVPEHMARAGRNTPQYYIENKYIKPAFAMKVMGYLNLRCDIRIYCCWSELGKLEIKIHAAISTNPCN